MFRKLLLSLLALSLTACQSSTTGVFRGMNEHSPSPLLQKSIGQDAAEEISSIFLPAQQRLGISTDRPFGKILSSDLRTKGFSIEELSSTNPKPSNFKNTSNMIRFNYLLDGLGDNHWRLELIFEEKKYTREYQSLNKPNGLLALGSWVKEVNHD